MWTSNSHYGNLKNSTKLVAKCPTCGCECETCNSKDSLQYHHDIEKLQSNLRDTKSFITRLEEEISTSKENHQSELSKLHDDLTKLKDKYDRLYDNHKKLSKLNQTLEEKLLNVVDTFNANQNRLECEYATCMAQLKAAHHLIEEVEEERDRYKTDCNIAVQLLQENPSGYVSQKLNSLPYELQHRLQSDFTDYNYIAQEAQQSKLSYSMISTFPPTAAVFDHSAAVSSTISKTVTPYQLSKVLGQPVHPSTSGYGRIRIYLCQQCRHRDNAADRCTQTVRQSDSYSEDQSPDSSYLSISPVRPYSSNSKVYSSSFLTAKPYSNSVLDI